MTDINDTTMEEHRQIQLGAETESELDELKKKPDYEKFQDFCMRFGIPLSKKSYQLWRL